MSKLNQLLLAAILTVVVVAGLNISAQNAPTTIPTETATPTVPATTQETPSGTNEPGQAYWEGALYVQQVSGGHCKFEICQHLQIRTDKTCSSITLFGATTKDSGKVVDYFEQNYKRLPAGASRVVEFGTDPANSYENFVELQDAMCWK